MARSYPRFLFSDPSYTKSKGPFIVHLIYPRLICRLFNDQAEDPKQKKNYYIGVSGWYLELLDVFDDNSEPEKIQDAMYAALVWASNQDGILKTYKTG